MQVPVKKLSIELKEILLDLDEEDSYHQKQTIIKERFMHRHFSHQKPYYSTKPKQTQKKVQKRTLTETCREGSMKKTLSNCASMNKTLSKPVIQLSKVMIGKPELPYRLRNLKSQRSPSGRNRIKIVIRNCVKHESLWKREGRK